MQFRYSVLSYSNRQDINWCQKRNGNYTQHVESGPYHFDQSIIYETTAPMNLFSSRTIEKET